MFQRIVKKIDKIIKRKSIKRIQKNLANISRSIVTRRLHNAGLFDRICVKKIIN